MAGTVKWTATYTGQGSNLQARLYDDKGTLAYSVNIPCVPPVACPFPIEGVEYGVYKAAIVNGQTRYYYNDKVEVVTVPNDEAHATPLTVSSSNPDIEITIVVHA